MEEYNPNFTMVDIFYFGGVIFRPCNYSKLNIFIYYFDIQHYNEVKIL